MTKISEISFIKKVIISIKDFEKYPELAMQKIGSVILYIIKLLAIFTVVVSLLAVYQIVEQVNQAVNYIENDLPDISYANNELKVELSEKIVLVNEGKIIDKVIIDTSDIDLERLDEYKTEMQSSQSGIIILKDRVVLSTQSLGNNMIEYFYKDILKEDVQYNKSELISYIKSNVAVIGIVVFIVNYIYLLTYYLITTFFDILIFAAVGFITAFVIRMPIKYGAMFKIAAHSITLPLILNLALICVETFTNIEIKYYEFIYMGIAYVYILAAIFMIKANLIKRGQELEQIIQVQEKVKMEIEEQEIQEKEEKEKQEEKNKDSDKDSKKKEDEPNNEGVEPQGESI